MAAIEWFLLVITLSILTAFIVLIFALRNTFSIYYFKKRKEPDNKKIDIKI